MFEPKDSGLDINVDVSFPTRSLVLIHGFNGDSKLSYKHENNTCWPEELLKAQHPTIRVLSWGYNADVYNTASIAGIRDNAQKLLVSLQNARDASVTHRPIIFLAHSLGG